VKYARSAGGRLTVRCRSHSLSGGKVIRTKCYTAETIDWLAVYDDSTQRIYYIPAAELGQGMFEMTLRTEPARNNQLRGVRDASLYTTI
jgi:PD-(D/E)XK endonuclease